MKCSICIASYDKAPYLQRTLESIFRQDVPFPFEVIVVDDGTPDDSTRRVCRPYPLSYFRVDRKPGFRNQSQARNQTYRLARGEIIISQSDDTLHVSPNCIQHLVDDLTLGHFIIANVLNTDAQGNLLRTSGVAEYTGQSRQKPYFFLGSLYLRDVYAVGGNDEEFMAAPSYEDDWFGDCLIHGLGLIPVYSTTIVGHHLDHPHTITERDVMPSKMMLQKKREAARRGESLWQSASGPWKYEEESGR